MLNNPAKRHVLERPYVDGAGKHRRLRPACLFPFPTSARRTSAWNYSSSGGGKAAGELRPRAHAELRVCAREVHLDRVHGDVRACGAISLFASPSAASSTTRRSAASARPRRRPAAPRHGRAPSAPLGPIRASPSRRTRRRPARATSRAAPHLLHPALRPAELAACGAVEGAGRVAVVAAPRRSAPAPPLRRCVRGQPYHRAHRRASPAPTGAPALGQLGEPVGDRARLVRGRGARRAPRRGRARPGTRRARRRPRAACAPTPRAGPPRRAPARAPAALRSRAPGAPPVRPSGQPVAFARAIASAARAAASSGSAPAGGEAAHGSARTRADQQLTLGRRGPLVEQRDAASQSPARSSSSHRCRRWRA